MSRANPNIAATTLGLLVCSVGGPQLTRADGLLAIDGNAEPGLEGCMIRWITQRVCHMVDVLIDAYSGSNLFHWRGHECG